MPHKEKKKKKRIVQKKGLQTPLPVQTLAPPPLSSDPREKKKKVDTIVGTAEPQVQSQRTPFEGITKDVKTGRPSGFIFKGKQFPGVSNTEDIELFQAQQALIPGSVRAQFQQQQAQQAAAKQLEQAGVFEEQGVGAELQPGISAQGIGGAFSAFDRITAVQAVRTTALLSQIDKGKLKDMTLEEFHDNADLMADPFFSDLIKTELDLEVLKSSEAQASFFGAFIEAIPGVGNLAKRFASTISTPSGQVDDILSEINLELSFNRNIREWVGMNTYDPDLAAEHFDKSSERLDFLETKIRFLILQSDELRSSPEEIDRIMVLITQARGVIFNGRQKIGEVKLTGLNPATPAQTFETLKKLKKIERERGLENE